MSTFGWWLIRAIIKAFHVRKSKIFRKNMRQFTYLFYLFASFLLSLVLILRSSDAYDSQTDLNELKLGVARTSNESLLWGTYRPNLYFGVRPRLPESILTGLIWFNAEDLDGLQKMRHGCDQGDGFHGYGYFKHDGRSYALQRLYDTNNNLNLTTEFIKMPGGENGGEWGVRISGKPFGDRDNSKYSVLFYIGLEGKGGLEMTTTEESEGLYGPITVEGDTPDLGEFSMHIINGPNNLHPESITALADLVRTQYWGANIPIGQMWRAKEYVQSYIFEKAQRNIEALGDSVLADPASLFTLGNELPDYVPNFLVFQKVFEGAFEFDVYFRSESSPVHISPETFTTQTSSISKDFDIRFERTFQLDSKGYNSDEIEFSQYLLSNLIGGIGYFYGTSIVDRSYNEEDESSQESRPMLSEPGTLFTATPSRSFFPRGFYWDEGFHQLLIGHWDNDLSLDIIQHWMSLIEPSGWVAREQILGAEARSRVPEEFRIQYPHYANPPTLLMAIRAFIDRLENPEISSDTFDPSQPSMHTTSINDPVFLRNRHLLSRELAADWLEKIYPKIRLNWQWFRRTQRGEIKNWGRQARNSKEAYRWRGRTPEHTLTSGLDDYPRANPPHIGELHLDLMSWMGFSTRLLKSIAEKLQGEEYEDDIAEYELVEKHILWNLEDLHWSETDQSFCDLSVDEDDDSIFICHKGYLTLFPLLLGLLPPDSPKLGALLDIMHNPEELWSPFGLRSLSKSDSFYYTGEVYWRGPIWINVNYMALASLYKNYINVSGPYQAKARQIYTELRQNIFSNVYEQYKRSGFVWEQYDAHTGEGKRSHPFTGWTSLVLLIMAEKY